MPAPTDRPSGAFVTGASSGIGRATALRLADEGIPVVLTGRDPEVLETLAEECRAKAGTASVVELDVRDEEAVTRAVAEAGQAFGRGFVVVHSAAVVAYGLFEEVPSGVLADTVATNVLGTIHVARAALQAFRRSGAGHLVVIGSLLGEVAAPYMGSYVLSKWAVHGLVRTLQIETRHRQDVAVSLVAPGGIDTPIYRQAATVLGRHGSPPPPVRTRGGRRGPGDEGAAPPAPPDPRRPGEPRRGRRLPALPGRLRRDRHTGAAHLRPRRLARHPRDGRERRQRPAPAAGRGPQRTPAPTPTDRPTRSTPS